MCDARDERLDRIEAIVAVLLADAAWRAHRARARPIQRPATLILAGLLRQHVRPAGRDFLTTEIIEVLDVEGDLRDALVAVIGVQRKGRAHRLGRWLGRMKGVEVDGWRIVRRVRDLHNTARWAFEAVGD